MVKTFFCIVACILSLASPAGLTAAGADEHGLAEISRSVQGGPGALAWSEDGTRLLFLEEKGLTVYDTASRERKKLGIGGVYFASWAPGGEVLLLLTENGVRKLAVVGPDGLEVKKTDLAVSAVSVHPLAGRKGLVVLSEDEKALKIGREVSYKLSLLDPDSGGIREVYSTGRILPLSSPKDPGGWASAGLNPMDTTALLVEYLDPPALSPYLSIKAVDYMTGKSREIARLEPGGATTAGSWSPDGSRVALSDGKGRLVLLGLDGSHVETPETSGRQPSWNPRGSQIFFGGRILTPGDGSAEVLSDGKDSFALWSPDGTKAAVVSGKRLLLLEGFRPSYAAPDRPLDAGARDKVRLLKELYSEGLISEGEYQQRRERIMKK